ncbi:MAG: DUF2848 family protein [Rhodospirillales bacterium]|nr:DUF2848 family protein [Rhodospirillales bacterium]
MLRAFWSNSLALDIEYRADFLINLVSVAVSLAAGLLVIAVMFSGREAIAGWTFEQALTLYGIFLFFEEFSTGFLAINIGGLPELVRRGDLDFLLLKPMNSQLHDWALKQWQQSKKRTVGVYAGALGYGYNTKQLAGKVLGRTLWRLDELRDRWDSLMLRAHVVIAGERVLYQEGALSLMRTPDDLMQRYGKPLTPGTVMMSGTLNAIGGIRPASRFEMQLQDSKGKRAITHAYDVSELPVIS